MIDFQFPSCCTSQPPKKLNQIITVNSSTNTPRSYHQKKTLARFACLCFSFTIPMESNWYMNEGVRDLEVASFKVNST